MDSLQYSEQVEVGEGGSTIRVPDLQHEFNHVVYVQHSGAPLSNKHPVFRVKVVQLAKEAAIGVGISSIPIVIEEENEEQEVSSSHSLRDAIIYHSDNGSVSTPARGCSEDEVALYGEGDVITFVIEQLAAAKSLVCVLKNDQLQCRRWVTMKAVDLFPTVNMWWGPAELHVDWLCMSGPTLSLTNLHHWMRSSNLTVESDELCLDDDRGGVAQAPHPLQQEADMYFEAKVVSLGEEGKEGPHLGLTTATCGAWDRTPGEEEGTISYNAAGGKIVNSGQASRGRNLGAAGQCQAGDTLGCGFIVVETEKPISSTQMVVVYLTKNRAVVHHCNVQQSIGGFYPTVAFTSKGSTVRVNMAATPPDLPDKSDWVAAAKRALDFPGLGMFEIGNIKKDVSSKHEEGITEGHFRFSKLIGCPTSDRIQPQSNLLDANQGKLLQLLKTITPSEPYFTVKILELGAKSMVCVGVSREAQSCGTIPGSLVDSAGYSSSGHILLGGGGHFGTEKFEKGDVLGVHVEFVDLTKVVQFNRNGHLVGQCVIKGSNKDIYPSLGFRGVAPAVHVTWPRARPDAPPPYSKDKLENWLRNPGLLMSGRRLTPEMKTRRLRGKILISPQSLSHAWSYFEVQITCKTSSETKRLLRAPIVGLTNHLTFSKYKRLVNQKDVRDIRYFCHANSVGYVDYLKHELLPMRQCIQSGDCIGWGLVYPSTKNIPSDRARQVVIAYCCINGQVVYHKPLEQPGGGLYPSVTLYKYGEEAELLIDQMPPDLGNISSWLEEADEFRIEVDKQRKAAGLHKQTAEDRRARPATPSKRPDNHRKKHTVYIHCDPERYNEATHIQARLDAKGFVTALLPQEKLNNSRIGSLIDDNVSTCTSVVCCMGPEISQTKHMGRVLETAQQRNKPVLPFILEKLKWPPEGALQKEWQKLVMHKIETSGDFDWAIQQIEEKTLNLKDKGYNGREIRVGEGKGAKMLYTDAQKGGKTTNEESDPNALKKAIADADRFKAKSIGSDDIHPTRGGWGGINGGARSLSFSTLQEPMAKNFEQDRRRPQSSRGHVNQSKACVIL